MNQRAFCAILFISALGLANGQTAPSAATGPEPPVPYSSVSQLNQMLEELEKTSNATQVDLAKLRIERWKTGSDTKRQTQSNVDSLVRNMHDALPGMITSLRNSPENLAATFKLYRNLDALYDVFSSVVEAAGAFGSKDEFQSLDNDLNLFEKSRHSMADRMETLSAAKEVELIGLRTKVQNLQIVSAAPPPKKTVVDDTEPPKKPVKKKTPAKTTNSVPTANPAPTPPANPNQ